MRDFHHACAIWGSGVRVLCFVGLVSAVVVGLGACAEQQKTPSKSLRLEGYASYYASRFHGRTTASGEVYNENHLTAAHRSLPFGTRVRVHNLENGRSVVVRINDRGPYAGHKRIIDVSLAAAQSLGMLERGIVKVRLQIIKKTAPGLAAADLETPQSIYEL